ncbi:MAG: Ig-like domain-containing protein [Candidatus Hatepunaea meridiana]|nr:Ig-like domain-containing protein [Candidatus Hatepunaea meridiana]
MHVNRTPIWDDVPEPIEINENELIEFTLEGSDPDDDNLFIEAASDNLPEGWEFIDNEDGTSSFEWRPTFVDSGEYSVIFTIADEEFEVDAEVDITVIHVNRTPIWDNVQEAYEIDENELLEFTVEGSDLDGDDLTIEAVSDNLPEGWEFIDNEDGTGSFEWRPTFDDSGEYTIVFTIADAEFEVASEVDITVMHVNRTPIWDDIPEPIEINENDLLEFTIEGSDPDDDDLTIEAVSDNLPEGWEFTDNEDGTGFFEWRPTFDDSGEYSIIFTIADDEFEVDAEVDITVVHVNRTPIWDNVQEAYELEENELLEFTIEGSDPDGDDLAIEATYNDLPDGWEFTDNGDGNGAFEWRPSFDDSGDYTIVFTIADDEFEVDARVDITVVHVNRTVIWDNVPESEEVNEDQPLEFMVEGSDPDDDDLTIEAVSGDLPEGWQFTDFEDGTGRFSWQSEFDASGEYSVVFTITDGEFEVDAEVAITVIDINRTPEWDEIPESVHGNEDEELTFNVRGSDPDSDDLTITYSSENLPDEAEFTDNGNGTGVFTWTPGFEDGGSYLASLTLSDDDFEVTREVVVTVGDVNRPPVWEDESPESVQTNEAQQLEFTVIGSDPDQDTLTIAYRSDDLPESVEFVDNEDGTGTFTWTPTYDESGEYTTTFIVSDEEFDIERDVTVTVIHVNRTPIYVDAPEELEVNENQELEFVIEASDPDEDNLTLTAASENLPEGWEFADNHDGTGTFNWTPGFADSGEYSVTVTVADEEFEVETEVAITVIHVNVQPEWVEPPEQVEVDEDQLLEFTVEASDFDEDDLTVTAASENLPEGWEFTDNEDGTGTFAWTPGFADSGEYAVIFTVADAEFEVETEVAITVIHVNLPPEWAEDVIDSVEVNEDQLLEFTVEASDFDEDDLTIEASSEDLPEGWEFADNEDGTGTFAWTPSFAHSGEYSITVTVADEEFEVETEVVISVIHVNVPPEWEEPPEQVEVNEDQLLEFTLEASDFDEDNLTVAAASENLPEGWEFTDNEDGTGTFTWTPGFTDSGEYTAVFTVADAEFEVETVVAINVIHVNLPPEWAEDVTDSVEVNEDQLLEFTVEASDFDEDDFTMEASSESLPEGWEFTDNEDGTGTFNWTPGFADSGEYTVILTVADAEFEVETEVVITVIHVNVPPEWVEPPEQIEVDEDQLLEFTIEASDFDEDNLTVIASSENLPEGWEFTDNEDGTGTFTWTPDFAASGEYTAVFTVADAEFEVETEVVITVIHVNLPPEWAEDVTDSVEVGEDQPLEFTVEASDFDEDNLIVTAASDDLPEGWEFTDNEDGTGTFNWTPGFTDSGEYSAVFTVADAEFEVETEVVITVIHVNVPPEWVEPPEQVEVEEDQLLEFTVEASDFDEDDLTITAVSENLPEGWEFTDNENGTGTFAWTPGFADSGEYSAVLTVADAEFEVETEVIITVIHVNVTPEWVDMPESEEVEENQLLEFTVDASDFDGDDLTIEAVSENLPEGWEFTDYGDGSGLFEWTPGFDDSGEYSIIFTVADDEFEVDAEVSIAVIHVNRIPVWDDIPESVDTPEEEELTFSVHGSDPDDDNLTIEYSSDDLPDAVQFTDNDEGSGEFVWTPGEEDDGSYEASFTLSDGDLEVTRVVVITVGDVNQPPIWVDIPESVETDEIEQLQFTVEGSDPDDDRVTITYSSEDLPDDVEFVDNENGTGTFTWTPTYDDAGVYTATFTISDAEFDISRDATVTVFDINRTPEWVEIPEEVEVRENQLLEFGVECSDPDNDNLIITVSSEDLPEDWDFTDNHDGTGVFSWMPGYDASGEYRAVFMVTDDEFEVETEVVITVIHINVPPEFVDVPEQVEVDEDQLLEFTIEATDFDEDDLTIVAASENLPEGWEFIDNEDGTGSFDWTPDFEDSDEYSITFTVADAEFEVEADVIISVGQVNVPPEWADAPERVEVNEDQLLEFTVMASDLDEDDLILGAISEELPEGWEFIDNEDGTGTFTWTPGYEDSGEFNLTLIVSDYEFDVEAEVIVTVIHVNLPPEWVDVPESAQVSEDQLLEFTIEATDFDEDDLIIEASSEDLPEGWEFTDSENGTGTFAWTPGFDDGGQYTVTFTVSDGEITVDADTRITVVEENRTPEWVDVPENVDANENELIEFMVIGSDPDDDDLTIGAVSENLPEGWEFIDFEDGSGRFTWQTGFNDVGEYSITFILADADFDVETEVIITVVDFNRAPVWEEIPESIHGEEEEELTFNVSGSDPDDDDLTISYFSGDLPDDVEFTDNEDGSGVFTWTPDYEAEGSYRAGFTLSDGDIDVTQIVVITVGDVNQPPTWDQIPLSVEIPEAQQLQFTVRGSDPDENDVRIVYSSDDLPDNVEFEDNEDGTGTFTWIPNYDEAGAYTATFTISDEEFDISRDVTVTVTDVNRTPDWVDIPEVVEVDEDQLLEFVVEGSDPDGDNLAITVTSEDMPEGWEFADNHDGTGTLSWNPTYDNSGNYTLLFTLTDEDFEVEHEVTLTVNHINRIPFWIDPPELVEISENQLLEFTLVGSDLDTEDEGNLTIEAISEDLPGGWEFTDNEDGTGTFNWEPGFEDSGIYTALFILRDAEFEVETEVAVRVVHVNREPGWDEIPQSAFINEDQLLEFTVEGSDLDVDDLTIIWQSTGETDIPADQVEFTDNDDGTADFAWTPDYDAAGQYIAAFTISDGEFNIEADVRITVNNTNREPIWDEPDPNEAILGSENEELIFEAIAHDPDDDDLTIEMIDVGGLPEAAEFTDNGDGTGSFVWRQVGFEDEDEYYPRFAVSDGDLSIEVELTIIIEDVNRPPEVVSPIDDVEFDEDSGLHEVANLNEVFEDPDGDDITFNVDGPEELNLTITDENVLTIEPDEDFFGEELEVIVTADDNRENGQGLMVARFNADAQPRRDLSTDEQFMVSVIGINDVPRALVDDPYTIEMAEDQEPLVIDPPLAELFYDPDPDDEIVITWEDGEGPVQLSLDDDRVNIVATLVEENWNGEFEYVITARDGNDGETNLTFAFVVAPVNDQPEIVNDIENVEVEEDSGPWEIADLDEIFFDVDEDELNFDVEAPDDIEFEVNDENILSLNAIENFSGEDIEIVVIADDGFGEQLAAGIQVVMPNGAIRPVAGPVRQMRRTTAVNPPWLTAETRQSNYPRRDDTIEEAFLLTVTPLNDPPEWIDFPNEAIEVNEGVQVEFTVTADDVDLDWEGDELTLSVVDYDGTDDMGAEFSVEDNVGTFIWQTGFDHEGEYTIVFEVADQAEETDRVEVPITVTDRNCPPEWIDVPETVEVDEDQLLEFTVEVSDFDGDYLTIEASSENLPEGWEFTDNEDGTGSFAWTPGFADSGDYSVTLTVADAEFEVETEVLITVIHVNVAPEWIDVPVQVEVDENQMLEFTVEASDFDEDELHIEVTSENLPEGWEFTDNNDGTGTFAWTPTYDDAGVYTALFTLSDSDVDVEAMVDISVRDVNRAPSDFRLLSPEDRFEVERENYNVNFEWEEAVELDDDDVDYSLFINIVYEEIDSTVTIEELADNEFNIEHLDSVLIGMGIIVDDEDIRVDATWWVEANDGELTTESSERWTIVVPIPMTITGSAGSLPTEYSLSQNYPNPFNSTTHINFALPSRSEVRLAVWDMSGRLLEVIVSGNLPAGNHNATWTANDLPTGVYVFTLETEGVRLVTKGVLVR